MSETKTEVRSISDVVGEVRRDFVDTRETMAEKSAAGEAIGLVLTRLEGAGFAVKRRGVLRVVTTTTARAAFVRLLGALLRQAEEDGRRTEGPARGARDFTEHELGKMLDTLLEAIEVFPTRRLVRGRLKNFPDDDKDYWIEPFDGGPDLRLQDLFPDGVSEIELAIAGRWGEEGL